MSYHLAQLRDAGIVTSTAQGRSNRYRVRSAELDRVATLIGTVHLSSTMTQPSPSFRDKSILVLGGLGRLSAELG